MSAVPLASKTVRISGKEAALYNDACFSRIRKHHGVRDNFLDIVGDVDNTLQKTNAKGGAMMGFIGGDYVVKSLSSGDHKSLLEITGSYVEHMLSGESLLAPMYLHYRRNGVNYFVMGNTCGKGKSLAKYDLKGCDDDKTLEKNYKRIKVVHKRWFKPFMWCGSCAWSDARNVYFHGKVEARAIKFTVTEKQREQILAKMKRDTDWLKKENLMDYSLLVVRREGPPGSFARNWHHLPCQRPYVRTSADGDTDIAEYIGIVDYLQKWNFLKVVAKYIKTFEPRKATIEPEPYANRFYEHFQAAFVAN